MCLQALPMRLILMTSCLICNTQGANNGRAKGNRTFGKNYILNDYHRSGDTGATGFEEKKNHRDNLDQNIAIVSSKMGYIGGNVIQINGFVTSSFLGIPYALPPVGKGRFLPPRKHFGWGVDKVWDATKLRSLCYQDTKIISHPSKENEELHYDHEFINAGDGFSEDCLYLNLYIPRNISGVEHVNTMRLPVVVYIHDGELSNEVDGTRLASQGGIIVATLDYRQGVLGFLSLLDDSAPGNLGLLDQKQALHWIWDNIQEFGGNPMSITVFGHGFGAVSISYHLLSSVSKGLFHGAVLQSSSMLTPHMIQESPIQNAQSVIVSLNCGKNSNFTAEIECLRRKSVARIQQMGNSSKWLPVIDGYFLQRSPDLLLKSGEFNKVPIVVGVENSFAEVNARQKGYSKNIGVTKQALETEFRNTLGPVFMSNIEQVIALVLSKYDFCDKTVEDRYHTLVNFFTDYYYLWPVHKTAKLWSREDRSVYFYEYLQFESGYVHKANNFMYKHIENHALKNELDVQEKELDEIMMEALSNFARTGNPNPVNLKRGTYWFPFNETSEHYLQFYGGMDHLASKSFPQRQRMAFWDFLFTLYNASLDGTCQSGRDVCAHRVRSVAEEKEQTKFVLYIIAGLGSVLLFLVIVLLLKLVVPASSWPQCCVATCCCCRDKHLKVNGVNHEHRYLRPLPYYEES